VPSLADIANDIKNILNQVQTNTQNTAATDALIKADTGDIRTSVHTLIADEEAGFVSLSNGLAAMIDQQKATNSLLDYERRQNDTIICWLTNIADLLCRSLHRQDMQLEIQAAMEKELRQIKDTQELVYGTETVEVLKRYEIEARLEKCCPCPKPEPEPCYVPCQEPKFQPYEPQVPPYKPLPPATTGTGQPK